MTHRASPATVGFGPNLVHNLGLAGVRVEYLTLSPDETAVGEFRRWIMAGVGQLERATILERTHAGRLAKARSGRFLPSRWPYGYRYVAGMLEADPAAALVVRELFEAVGDEGPVAAQAGAAPPGARVVLTARPPLAADDDPPDPGESRISRRRHL